MAHQDPVDPLAECDALLRQELSVEPSTSFLPRVREQIRTEPAASWSLWRFAPLAAAAALVLAIGVFMLSRANDTNPSPLPTASGPRSADPVVLAVPQLRKPLPTKQPQLATTNTQRPTTNGVRNAKEPEIIVDEHQREALQAFVRMINQGQLTGEKFKQTTPPPVDIAEAVTIIGVVPVSVSPIVVGGVLQGESERK